MIPVRLTSIRRKCDHDRLILLADPERTQDHDLPGGGRATLPDHAGNIGAGEQFQPDFLAFRPTTACRRWSIRAHGWGYAAVDLRIRRHSRYLAEKTGKFLPEACAAICRPPNGFTGRSAASARWPAKTIISTITRPKAALRHRPLCQGNQPALRRADRKRLARPRLYRRRLFHRRHGKLSLDRAMDAAGPEPRRFP